MAELYDEVVVYPFDAIRKTSEALSLVNGIRSDLDRETRRQAEDSEGSAVALDDIVIKRDPLMHALHRSSRHITRLRETLSAQTNIPVEDYWLDGRHTMIIFEKSKAESSLNAAHAAANDTYQAILEEIGNTMHSGRSSRTEMQSKIQMYDRFCANTASALSVVTEALYGFPATISRQRPRFERAAVEASVGEGVAVERSRRERKHRESFPERPIYLSKMDSAATTAVVHDGDGLGGDRDRDRDAGRNASAARRSSRKQRAVRRRQEAEVIDLTGGDTRFSNCGGATASTVNNVPADSQLSPYLDVAMAADDWGVTRRPRTGPSQSPSAAAVAEMAADEWPLTPRPAPGLSPTAAAAETDADEWPLTPCPAPGPSPNAADADAVVSHEWRATRAPGTRERVTQELTPSPPPAAIDERWVNLKPTSSSSPAATATTEYEQWVNSHPEAGPPQTASAAVAMGEQRVIPISRVGARGRRATGHPTAAAAVNERRRLMARASPDRFGARDCAGGDGDACVGRLDCTCSGGWVDAYVGLNRAREETRSVKGSLSSRKNRKPSATEQHMASVNLMQGRPAIVPRRRNRQASEREGATVTVSTDRPSRRVAARTSDHHLSPPPFSLTPMSLTAARVGGNRSDRVDEERHVGNLQNHFAVENSDLLRDDVFQAILDDEDLVSLLSDTRSPQLSGEATRARRRSLVRIHSIGSGVDSTPVLRRSLSTGRSSRRARASLEELSPSSGRGSRDGVSDGSYDVDDDEAAAQRIFRQELEARTRQDELMAQQLAANEQARVERILSRHLRHYRRAHRHSYVLDPAAAAAVATGDEVSDAIRALQFQDIDENDFDTLLTLDEQGGVGGRNCAGRRGLDDDFVKGLLRPWTETVTGEEELCSICLDDYTEDKKITTLPCGHAFHFKCIKRSLCDNNRCPVDMNPVVPDSPNSARGAGNR